jgi:hypothetical protein
MGSGFISRAERAAHAPLSKTLGRFMFFAPLARAVAARSMNAARFNRYTDIRIAHHVSGTTP